MVCHSPKIKQAFNFGIKIKVQLLGVMTEVKQCDRFPETPPSLLLLATTFTAIINQYRKMGFFSGGYLQVTIKQVK